MNELYLKPDARVLDASKLDDAVKNDIKDGYGSLSQADITDYAIDEGYDAVDFSGLPRRGFNTQAEVKVLKQEALQTKSQLIDIWDKANQEIPKDTISQFAETQLPKIPVKEAPPPTGVTLYSGIDPGLDKFINEDIKPGLQGAGKGFTDFIRSAVS